MEIKNIIVLILLTLAMPGIAISSSINSNLVKTKDENKDGEPDVWLYKIDEKRRLMKQDFNYDGTPDTCGMIAKDDSIIILRTDFGCDGSIESWEIENDNEKWLNLDINSDNLIDIRGYFINRQRVKYEADLNFDGKFDATQFYKDDVFSHCEVDSDQNGIVEYTFYKVSDFDDWTQNNYPEFVQLNKMFFKKTGFKR